MFKRLKKIGLIFVGILVCVISFGNFILYRYHICSYKAEFKSYIKTNQQNIQTDTIKINVSELYKNGKDISWEDENKEVNYKGNLYDIINISVNNEEVILTVLLDKEEAKIKNQFADSYNQNPINTSSNKPAGLLKQFLALKYIKGEILITCPIFLYYYENNTIYHLSKTTYFQQKAINPPDLTLSVL